MNTEAPIHDYLVLSRGHWDKDASKEQINDAIDQFYVWLTQNIEAGKMRTGSRLTPDRASVSKAGVITDAALGEAKEVVGGYWFFVAASLDEACALAAQNPCIACGLQFEVRPIEPVRASAYVPSNETPDN